MSLKAQLQSDLNGAIKSRNTVVAETIRMVLSAITNEEVAGKEKKELSDAEVITVLTREAKKRREAAEAFEQGGRADKASTERAEGEVGQQSAPDEDSPDPTKRQEQINRQADQRRPQCDRAQARARDHSSNRIGIRENQQDGLRHG